MAEAPPRSAFLGFFKDVWSALLGGTTSKAPDGGSLGRAGRFLKMLDKGAKKIIGGTMARMGAKAALTARLEYKDAQPEPVISSWIESLTFTPMRYRFERALPDEYSQGIYSYRAGGTQRNSNQAGFINVPDEQLARKGPDDVGDLTMKVIRPSAPNPSRKYTYPMVPRAIMDEWLVYGSAGKYYWEGQIRGYSNRRVIFQRALLRTARQSSTRRRRR